MSDLDMQPPPCADHGYNRLDCPECGDARRMHYEKLATSLDAAETDDPPLTPGRYGHISRLDGESTSARLRRVEQELAEALEDAASLRRSLAAANSDRGAAGTELTHLRRERDQLRADLTEALDELERTRYSGWQAAREGGRDCAACPHEIRRGEAYSVNTTSDERTHVFCPNKETT